MRRPNTSRSHWMMAAALSLGSALVAGTLLLLIVTAARGAPDIPGAPPSAPQEIRYHRTQTVTLHSPQPEHIYATTLTTTFQIKIQDYVMGSYLRLPLDAAVRISDCVSTQPATATCYAYITIVSGDRRIIFTNGITGSRGDIHLEYDTWSKIHRNPDERIIEVNYRVGPDPQFNYTIALTNTIVFTRSLEYFGQYLEPFPFLGLNPLIKPPGYTYYSKTQMLRWVLTSTPKVTFTATFTEPLLGSDLVIDRLEMSPQKPELGEPVRYTVTVRNAGPYESRAVQTELFIRRPELGAPTAPSDRYGGYAEHRDAALFKWVGTDSFWYAGLAPGDSITGTTTVTWPDYCTRCGVWARVDSTFFAGAKWYGYNPEGLYCELDADDVPTCTEELNNLSAGLMVVADIPTVYLPLIRREVGE